MNFRTLKHKALEHENKGEYFNAKQCYDEILKLPTLWRNQREYAETGIKIVNELIKSSKVV